MKANEIRIGNIVTVDNPKHHPKLKNIPLRVTGIQEVDFGNAVECHINLEHINQDPNAYYDTYSQFFRFIRPIPLTEEILIKAGFEIGGYNLVEITHPKFPRLFFVLGEEFKSIWWNYNISGTFKECESSQIEIIYLHQLQNLYFTLTGEEIKIDLE